MLYYLGAIKQGHDAPCPHQNASEADAMMVLWAKRRVAHAGRMTPVV
ncbi:MAG: hypothetical protein OJF49_003650 [Ktedonobacterales bacterium]|nr:MAG: hypothetical protein OJF49_003650 [Ktedonobacterales bacterium]